MKIPQLVAISVSAIILSGAVKADITMGSAERVSHCKALANLAYLAAKKVRTGRELKEIEKELSSVSQAALTSTNDGRYSNIFRVDYIQLLQDTFSKKPKFAKEYALKYRSECIGTQGQSD